MKKIMFVHLLNDYSGSPRILSQVIDACVKKGGRFGLLSSEGPGFLSRFEPNLKVIHYKWSKNKFVTLICFVWVQIQLFFKILRYYKQDVKVYVNTMLPFGAALAAKLIGKKVIYHIHETSFKSKLFKRFLRFAVEITANKIIFVSKSLKGMELFAVLDQRVIYNSLPDDFFNLARQHAYQWRQQGHFNVLMSCSLKEYKGVNEFVAIATRCVLVNDVTFTLVLNATQDEIDDFFAWSDLLSNIKIISHTKNMIPYYEQASLVLNLSRVDQWVETFGLTIIEAMAFGVPVIVPPMGGPTEIVTDGLNGYLISSYEVEKISNLVIELSKDQEKCLELSKSARIRAGSFRQEFFDQQILEVFRD